MVIPQIPLITVHPRPLNARLWELVSKENNGTATASELAELDRMCAELEEISREPGCGNASRSD